MEIEPTNLTSPCDALPIELSSPLGAGGGEEGIQVLVLGAHYVKYPSLMGLSIRVCYGIYEQLWGVI